MKKYRVREILGLMSHSEGMSKDQDAEKHTDSENMAHEVSKGNKNSVGN